MKKATFLFLLAALAAHRAGAQPKFTTGQKADFMISGPGFNQTGGPLRFNHPNGLASDGQNLVVCDRFNNRVLVWNAAPDSWDDLPDLVLGQPDFESNDPGMGKHQLNWPGNASAASNGTLAVADTDNDRILIWKKAPTANAQPADVAIDLTAISPSGAAQIWGWPWGVWTDGSRLAAVATSGHALLFWNTLPTTDNQPPDYTIDLPEFGTPRNISTDGATFFFVGDHNAKVNGQPGTFFWNAYPSAANQPFDFYRDEWIKGEKLTDGRLVASGLQRIYTWASVPTAAAQDPAETAQPSFYKNGDGVDAVVAAGKIFVNNYNGNNVLAYAQPPTAATAEPLFALGVQDFLKNTLDSIGYMQNPALSTDGTRLIVTSDFDRRIYLFNQIPTASGAMPDEAVSTQSWGIAPWDNALFQNEFVMAGGPRVAVWADAQEIGQSPPTQLFNGGIGSAQFTDLKGVALDAHFFYLADRSGKLFLWKGGVPSSATADPTHTISLPGSQLARLSSDGIYLCAAVQTPPGLLIFKISELEAGNLVPWKTVSSIGLLNLPAEALPFDGSLAVANQGAHNVLWWEKIEQAGDAASAVVLGQPDLQSHWPAIGESRLFMPGALMAHDGRLWTGEFKFSSRVLRFSPSDPTGVAGGTVSSDAPVFPNPTDGLLFLKKGVDSARVFDVGGRVVFDKRGFELTELNLTELPAGLYFLQTELGRGRFVKM